MKKDKGSVTIPFKDYRTGEVTQLRRIADILDEILRLVKKDMGLEKKK